MRVSWSRAAEFTPGILALALALLLAAQHPLWPAIAAVAVIFCAALTAGIPGLWLAMIPACLPWLDFSPWTGWRIVDEFDLLILSTLAGGFVRLAFERPAALPPWPRAGTGAYVLFGVSSLVGVARGLLDASPEPLNWFQDEAGPLNSLRVAKSALFVLLLLPLLHHELRRSPQASVRRLCLGAVAGAAIVALAVLWERAAYPGLWDFSEPYRTTALFWEMHVGGAAMDAYLALSTPFVVWALWASRSWIAWTCSAVFALLWAHACLTAFSRSVYGAIAGSMLLLTWLLWRQTGKRARWLRWRKVGNAALGAALIAEVLVVWLAGSFLSDRLDASDRDLADRLSHWSAGMKLLRSPTDWLLGIGSGRMPVRYAESRHGHEFSGTVSIAPADGDSPPMATVRGPRTRADLGGGFALTQRVPLFEGVGYSARLSVHSATDALLRLRVCEMHLLYERNCQSVIVSVRAAQGGSAWQELRTPLSGPALQRGAWFAPRMAVLALSVMTPGAAVELRQVDLQAGPHGPVTRNTRFEDGMAQWFPSAQYYFVPWHIDSLPLETLIERGVVGVLALAAWLAFAARSLLFGPSRGEPIAALLAAALAGVLLVGLLSSVTDMPRVAFLFNLLVAFAAALSIEKSCTARANKVPDLPDSSDRSTESARGGRI